MIEKLVEIPNVGKLRGDTQELETFFKRSAPSAPYQTYSYLFSGSVVLVSENRSLGSVIANLFEQQEGIWTACLEESLYYQDVCNELSQTPYFPLNEEGYVDWFEIDEMERHGFLAHVLDNLAC